MKKKQGYWVHKNVAGEFSDLQWLNKQSLQSHCVDNSETIKRKDNMKVLLTSCFNQPLQAQCAAEIKKPAFFINNNYM